MTPHPSDRPTWDHGTSCGCESCGEGWRPRPVVAEPMELRWQGDFGTVVGASGKLYGGIRRRRTSFGATAIDYFPSFDVAPWRKRGDVWTTVAESTVLHHFAQWAEGQGPR